MVWICAAWIITSIILTNAYRGDNITALTAPMEPIPFKNFSQLLQNNFSIFSRKTYQSRLRLMTVVNWGRGLSLSEFDKYMIFDRALAPFGKALTYEREQYIRRVFMQSGKIQWHPRAKEWLLEPHKYFLIFERCNNTALVGWKSDLHWMNIRLKVRS
jgi:hypothetical protein